MKFTVRPLRALWKGDLTQRDMEMIEDADSRPTKAALSPVVVYYSRFAGAFIPITGHDDALHITGIRDAGYSAAFRERYARAMRDGIRLLWVQPKPNQASGVAYIDCSTGNITKEDTNSLNRLAALTNAAPLDVEPYEEGYFVLLYDGHFEPADRERWNLSEALYAILSNAQQQGIRLVRFDRDGDVQPGLPVFDW